VPLADNDRPTAFWHVDRSIAGGEKARVRPARGEPVDTASCTRQRLAGSCEAFCVVSHCDRTRCCTWNMHRTRCRTGPDHRHRFLDLRPDGTDVSRRCATANVAGGVMNGARISYRDVRAAEAIEW